MYVAVMYGGLVDVESVARGLHMLINEGLGILTGNIAGMFSHPDGYRSTRLTNHTAFADDHQLEYPELITSESGIPHLFDQVSLNDLVMDLAQSQKKQQKSLDQYQSKGPHTILEIISPNVVRIDRPNQPLQRDTDTIHVNKLKLYTEKIHYISPPAVNTYHIKHNPNYTFPFKHLTPELFPTESLRFKPTSSEPFRHLDPAIFATRRFTSLFPDVKNCKPDNQLNHITPLPKDIKQENCEPTNHSNSTIHKVQANISESPVTKMWTNMGQYPIFHLIFILCLLLMPYNCIPILFINYLFIYTMPARKIFELQEVVFNLGQAFFNFGQTVFHCGQAILHCGQAILHCGQVFIKLLIILGTIFAENLNKLRRDSSN
ncbi:hypothetical protein LAZ67_9003740 [Cordylochernes scorpioides]|uniref:Uncharacterized protein n=1 Tax=Cordylochernes scorpioides TaxID=51811 RepID=A0ABY6KUL9_9ARAC|nr:hypothetical protein LAZ67_9003740 [Cordylochernes scorpioides]